MSDDELTKSVSFIVRRNVDQRVDRVLTRFDRASGMFKIVCCIDGNPNDDDWENCELSCAEIVAAFPEIRHAETECLSKYNFNDDNMVTVFTRA